MQRGWLRLSIVLLGWAACAVTANELLRRDAVTRRLPPPTCFYQDGVSERATALRRVQDTGQDIDVLFVGSSIVRSNISPHAFDRARGGDRISFNAGLSGLYPDSVGLYARRYWMPLARPRVVVHCFRMADVIARVRAQDDPRFNKHGWVERKWTSDAAWKRTTGDLVARNPLLQYQGVLGAALRDLGRGARYARLLERDAHAIDDRGWNKTTALLAALRPAGASMPRRRTPAPSRSSRSRRR